MEEVKFDFGTLRLAKVRQDELGVLMDVSRITVNGWVAGKPVHKARHKRLTNLLTAMASAVETGKLPLGHGLRQEVRDKEIKAILLEHLTLQKST